MGNTWYESISKSYLRKHGLVHIINIYFFLHGVLINYSIISTLIGTLQKM